MEKVYFYGQQEKQATITSSLAYKCYNQGGNLKSLLNNSNTFINDPLFSTQDE